MQNAILSALGKNIPVRDLLMLLLKATGKSRVDPANPATWSQQTKLEYNKKAVESSGWSGPPVVTPEGKVLTPPQGQSDTIQDYEFDNELRVLKPIPYSWDTYRQRHPPMRTKSFGTGMWQDFGGDDD